MGAHLGLNPLEDDIGSWYHHHFASIGIERVFAWQERVTPNPAAACADQLAVAVIQTGKVFAEFARVRHHHAHKTNLDDCFLDHFHGGKESVEVISAFHQNLQLTPAQTRGVDKPVWHLEIVMIGHAVSHVGADNWRDNLTRWQ